MSEMMKPRPEAKPQVPSEAVPLAFAKASLFLGRRPGYVFHLGSQGLGYYLDNARDARVLFLLF